MTLQRHHFASVNGLLDLYKSTRDNYAGHRWYRSSQESSQGAEILRSGTEQYNAEIEKLSKTIWESIPALRREWNLNFAGAFPNVPAYLAGEPMNMWEQALQESDLSPIRIWIGITSSGGIGERELVKRGAVLCTFAQALSERRPVLLTPYTALGDQYDSSRETDTIISWDIQTSPMVLSGVAASLCEPLVTRMLTIDIAFRLQPRYSGGWAYGYNDEAKMREVLGAEPDDLWLGSIHLYDPLLTDPIGWVRKHIKQYLGEDQDAMESYR